MGGLYPGLFLQAPLLICNEAVEANHSPARPPVTPAELATWPGGAAGILQSLLGSVETRSPRPGLPEVLCPAGLPERPEEDARGQKGRELKSAGPSETCRLWAARQCSWEEGKTASTPRAVRA